MRASAHRDEVRLGTHIAFFGSTSLLAKEMRSVLESRAFPADEVKLYDAAAEGTVSDYAGEALMVTVPDPDSIVGLDIAFMCGSAIETLPYLDWPARLGFVAIDLSGASLVRPGVPLVHTEINPAEIASSTGSGGAEPTGRAKGPAPVIGAPHAASHNLVTLVAAARGAGPIARVSMVALRPVSDRGDGGIDELYKQTVGLLNFSEVPQDVFGRQVAFNVLPSDAPQPEDGDGLDARIQMESSRLLGMPPERVAVSSAFVPMFHGHALATTIEFEQTVDMDALRQALGATRGVRVLQEAALSPAELAGEEAVVVLGLRRDPRCPQRVSCWSFCDNLKGGSALNAIRIAERVADMIVEARR